MKITETLKSIGEGISAAKPIIETVAPKLQESAKGFAERMLVLAEKYPFIEKLATMLDKVSSVMGDILYAMGISAEPAVVLGSKIEKADKGMEDFDSTEEYINYLQKEIEVDKEKLETLSTEEQVVYTIMGMAVEAGAIGEKLEVEIPADVVEIVAKIAEIGKITIDAKDIISIINKLKEEGITNLGDVCDCIKGEGDSDRLHTGEAFLKAIDAIKPSEGGKILNEIIDEVRE